MSDIDGLLRESDPVQLMLTLLQLAHGERDPWTFMVNVALDIKLALAQ